MDILPEETLDPEDWESTRDLGHKMLDDVFDYMKTISERPVWEHLPDRVKARFTQPIPRDPQPLKEVYEEFVENILPYPLGNIHPRFWGWVCGTGDVVGVLAEFLAASMNTGTGGGDNHVGNHVEKQVIDWIKDMLGYPVSASGLLTSGCSAANLIGLAVSRNSKAEYDLRSEGLQDTLHRMVIYASQEIHSSVQKAVELLGLGSRSLRSVQVNDAFQIDVDALRSMILQDRKKGFKPFCIVGAAGTTNTGAIDDLNALADICQQQRLWLHVDGAFGSWAVITPRESHRVAGIERADSIAMDLHKWMYMPFEIGCILVRDEEAHRKTFSLTPDYLSHGDGGRGLAGGDLPWFCDYGFQLTRGFRALKAWMALKTYGSRKLGRIIQQNIDQARYLADQIHSSPELELATPVTLNIVCFRYVAPELSEEALNSLNEQIVIELQEQGIAVPTGAIVKDKYTIRVSITNHRSRREDFDMLLHEVTRIGKELVRSSRNT